MPRTPHAPRPDFRNGGRNMRLSAMQAVPDCSHSYRTRRPILKLDGAVGARGVYCEKGPSFTATKDFVLRDTGITISCASNQGKVCRTVLGCVCVCCGPGVPRDASSHRLHMNSLVSGSLIILSLSLLFSFYLSPSLYCLLSVSLTRSLPSDRFRQIVSLFCDECPVCGCDAAQHCDTSDADTSRHRDALTPRACAQSCCHAPLR